MNMKYWSYRAEYARSYELKGEILAEKCFTEH